MNTLKVGDKVPNFSAMDQDGNSIQLKDLEEKNSFVCASNSDERISINFRKVPNVRICIHD